MPNWPRPVEALRAAREALQAYFAGLKAALLDKRLQHLADELARHDSHVERLAAQQREQQAQERELRRAIADSGGDRLERLALEISRKEAEKQRRADKAARYDELRQALGLLATAPGRGLPGPARLVRALARGCCRARGRAAERAERTGRGLRAGRARSTTS